MISVGELRAQLKRNPPPEPPPRARRAAVLVLMSVTGEDIRLVYTRRRDDLRQHPGQISFPGGGLEAGESIEGAALREAHEEIGLDTDSVTVLGRLPSLYLPPSRFWLSPVVALWDAPHELVPQPSEVAEIIYASVSTLTDGEALRAVQLSSAGWSWAWQLDDDHLLWGATGRVTGTLLDLLVPPWAPATGPSALPPERLVEPWTQEATLARERVPAPRQASPRRAPAGGGRATTSTRLQALVSDGRLPVAASPDPEVWAEHMAGLVSTMLHPGQTVAVLSGTGGSGALADRVARQLKRRGHPVGSHGRAGGEGEIPNVDLVVDGLVGRGLTGPLTGGPLRMVHALRSFTPRVVAVDVPTGLHPALGMVGEILAADVTMVYGRPARGLFRPGMSAFSGEVVGLGEAGNEARLVRLEASSDVGWRE